MGGIVDAITGGGSRDAADAQVDSAYEAIETQEKSLREQLRLGRESLNTQKEMFNTALELGQPYRDAGEASLARYESLLFGIPIGETAAYKAAVTESPGRLDKDVASNFEQKFRGLYASTDPKYAGRKIYFDTDSGELGLSGDVEIGKIQTSMAGFDDALKDAREKAEQYLNPEQEARDLSVFGDPDQTFGFETSPSYDFRRDEGQKALERSAAARSGVLSGAQLKATERYGQDFATQEYDNVLRRIGGLVDTGANMAGAAGGQALSSAGMQSGVLSNMAGAQGAYGSNVGSLQTQVGAARASGYLGTQQAGANVLNAVAGAFGTSFGGGGSQSPVRTFGTPNQSVDFGDYFSSGARQDINYASGGGYGPYRF